jgi:hypothetical protein
MPRIFHFIAIALIATLSASLSPRALGADKPAPVGKQDAEQLLADAKKALAFTVKSARAGGAELDPTKAEAKPFYESLKKIGVALNKASTALAAKDAGFFAAINEANDAANDMEVTWELTKSKDASVISGGKELSGAITALQENFNPLVERKEKGGDLTDEEKKAFDGMKEQMKGLLKEIHDLSAEDSKDVALEDGLKKIRMEARRVEKAPETVKAYVDAINSLSTIQGLIDGYSYFFTPAQKTEWETVETDSSSFTSDYSYSDYTYDWSETATEVDVYDSYSEDITEADEESEDSYVEDTSFDMTDEEDSEVADEGDELADDESDDMESDQEEEDDSEEDSDMDEADDDSGGDSDE